VLEFEPYIRLHIGELLTQWDKLAEGGKKGLSGEEGESGWFGKDGWVWFDCLPCESTLFRFGFVLIPFQGTTTSRLMSLATLPLVPPSA